MESLASFDAWASLFTLLVIEVVLSIDNLVFISILASRLPLDQQKRARQIGIMGALVTRVLMLISAFWIIRLSEPVITAFGEAYSWRDLMLVAGGLFLLAKGTMEIHNTLEGEGHDEDGEKLSTSFARVIVMIMLLDVVFSIDTVFTAVGMTPHLWVMLTAISIATAMMLIASEPLAAFIERHPTIKMLALAFLLLIGGVLLADGLHHHIPRGYVYAPVAFSILVEILNLAAAKRRKEIKARKKAKKAALENPEVSQ